MSTDPPDYPGEPSGIRTGTGPAGLGWGREDPVFCPRYLVRTTSSRSVRTLYCLSAFVFGLGTIFEIAGRFHRAGQPEAPGTPATQLIGLGISALLTAVFVGLSLRLGQLGPLGRWVSAVLVALMILDALFSLIL